MEYLPFQNFINTAPKQYIIPKGKHEVPDTEYRYVDDIEKILSSLNIETELNKLKSELFKIDESRHFLYVKLILEDLINTYFTIRKEISNIDENKDLQRKLMLEVYNAIIATIVLLNRMNINIPDDFITDYEKRDQTGIIIGALKMFGSQNKKPKPLNQNKPLNTMTSSQKEIIFLKLKETGYFIESNNNYQWTGSKALLAYFVDVASDILKLRPNNNRIPWKPFEQLFNITGLSSSRNEYKNKTGSLPDGYEKINSLFKE